MKSDFERLYNEHLGNKYITKTMGANYGGIDYANLRKDAGYQAAWDNFKKGYNDNGNI
jgi:hypothetical protein